MFHIILFKTKVLSCVYMDNFVLKIQCKIYLCTYLIIIKTWQSKHVPQHVWLVHQLLEGSWIVTGVKQSTSPTPGLVISTFGLADIISCMPDGLVKIYIGYWQTCQYSRIYLYSYSLFAENGVIVRNLNYRPWQWVYSISGCKSFPGRF